MNTHNEYTALHIQQKKYNYSWELLFLWEKCNEEACFSHKLKVKIRLIKKGEGRQRLCQWETGCWYLITLTVYKYIFTYCMISSCSKVRCYLGQYSTPLLILHDQGFTGSKFHSSSLQRLCFNQELAGNTIAQKRCDLLWGKLRLIMIKCSGFLVSWGQTLCSQSGKDPLNRFISQTEIEWFMQAYSQYWGLYAVTEKAWFADG